MRVVASRLAATGTHSMLLWVLDANAPARRFYEALGGTVVRHQPIEIGGVALTEVAYGWQDIVALLNATAPNAPGSAPTTRLLAKWGSSRGLTRDLLQFVDASDLAFSPSNRLGALWKHFRHLGRVQENYLRGIETGRVVFGFDGTSYTGDASKRALLDYFDRLDTRLEEQVRAIDVNRKIEWFDETLDVHEHVMRMADHEVLHHGMFIVYMRLLEKGFPPSWARWGV